MKLIQCTDCGSYNGDKDPECANCGKRFGNQPHKQDAKHDLNRRRHKKRFDDEDEDDDGDF